MVWRLVSLACLFLSSTASAQTGVSDDRVSLPEGPGSISGLAGGGDATGSFSYTVDLELPAAQREMKPALSMAYSSLGGQGPVGMGWSLGLPTLERSVRRGLPRYEAGDLMSASGEELVHVGDGVYRHRFEGAFIRYTWRDRGPAGSWVAEHPDGRIRYYGGDVSGPVAGATLARDGKVFRWYLVAEVDPLGHEVRYRYRDIEGTPHLEQVTWGHRESGARYALSLEWEARPDRLSSGLAGFEEVGAMRLRRLRVAVDGSPRHGFDLRYAQRPSSLLVGVDRIGSDGSVHPARFTFDWTPGRCATCRPELVTLPALSGGLSFTTGAATFVDLDGDALPDLVDASLEGGFRIWHNRLVDGRATLVAGPQSAAATRSEFPLGSAATQILDLDGNGLADLINGATGRALCNEGGGDFTRDCALGDLGVALADDTVDADPDPRGIRFFDVDGDRRVDVVRTADGTLTIRRRLDEGFESLVGDDIGVDFDTERLELGDMNGDGLLDIVQIQEDLTRFRLALGRGRMTPWREASVTGFAQSELPLIELEDLDGDGLSDLVAVVGSTVRYALNRGDGRFDEVIVLEAGDVVGGLPERGSTTSVLFADIDGSGSDDVIWVEPNGQVRYLALFPERPNLLAGIDSGLGASLRLTWATAVRYRTDAWNHPLPGATQVLASQTRWVVLNGTAESGAREALVFEYSDGYWDPVERQFRGFAQTIERRAPDDAGEGHELTRTYDLGVGDPHRAGLLLSHIVAALRPDRVVLESTSYTYDDVDLDLEPAPGELEIRHVALVAEERRPFEGRETAPTLRTRQRWDAYGNVTQRAEDGVIDVEGDERVTERDFIVAGPATGGRWHLRLPIRERIRHGEDGRVAETRYFYDGPDLVGLPAGQADIGLLTRLARVLGDRTLDHRFRYDTHGNIVAMVDPLGDDSLEVHAQLTTWDADGRHPIALRRPVVGPEGEVYQLVESLEWHPVFDTLARRTRVYIEADDPVSPADVPATSYTYDAMGRVVSITRPEDPAGEPGTRLAWELGAPASRLVVTRETGADTLELVTCLDGLGRVVDTLEKVGAGRYLSQGYLVRDATGEILERHEPDEVPDAACRLDAPTGPASRYTRDALGRVTRIALPDGERFGGQPTILVTDYAPLATIDRPAEPGRSPTTTRVDGLDRVIAIERQRDDGTTSTVEVRWDDLGNLAGYRVDGVEKVQSFDELGRLVAIDDPQGGRTTFVYDDAGDLMSRTDARGVTTRFEHDGQRRLVRTWDERDPATAIATRWDRTGGAEPVEGPGQIVEVEVPLPPEIAELVGGATLRETFVRDARDRLVEHARHFGELALVAEHGFDRADRLERSRYRHQDASYSVSWRRDGLGRAVEVPGWAGLEYDARGLLTRVERTDGSLTSYAWDSRRELSRHSVFLADGRAALDRAYTRNRMGQVSAVVDGREVDTGAADETATFGHDAWGRLVEATLGGASHRFTHDEFGLRDAQTPTRVGGDVATSRPGLVSRRGGLTLEHDEAGFVTRRGLDGDTFFEHDFRGLLVAATAGGGDSILAHDGQGELAASYSLVDGLVLHLDARATLHDGVPVVHVDADGQLLGRVEVEGRDPLADALGFEGERRAAALRGAARALIAEARGRTTMLFGDRLGSVVLATRGGEVVGARSYDPYGALRAERGSLDRRGFTGHHQDLASGLVLAPRRAFDPMSATWLSLDPLFEQADELHFELVDEALGRASYVGGAPLDRIDPDGLVGQVPTIEADGLAAVRAHWARVGQGLRGAQPLYRTAYFAQRTAEELARTVIERVEASVRDVDNDMRHAERMYWVDEGLGTVFQRDPETAARLRLEKTAELEKKRAKAEKKKAKAAKRIAALKKIIQSKRKK